MRTRAVLVLVLILATGLAVGAGGAAAGPAAALAAHRDSAGDVHGPGDPDVLRSTGECRGCLGRHRAPRRPVLPGHVPGPGPLPHRRGLRVRALRQRLAAADRAQAAGRHGRQLLRLLRGDRRRHGRGRGIRAPVLGRVGVRLTRTAGVWSLQQRLDGPTHSWMGWSVAISGDTLLAGAPAYYPSADPSPVTTGAAMVYTRAAGVWTSQQRLMASDGAETDRFGWSVGLDGDSAVIGAPFKNGGIPNGAGAAYVFTRTAGVWSQQLNVAGAAGANLGRSVALSGQTALAGAPGSYNAQGSVTVLQGAAGTWAKQTEFGSTGSVFYDRLGFSVALSGDQAVVGAPERTTANVGYSGAVYAFGRSGDVWAQQARIDPPTPGALMRFGFAVAVDGATVLAGEPSRTTTTRGTPTPTCSRRRRTRPRR